MNIEHRRTRVLEASFGSSEAVFTETLVADSHSCHFARWLASHTRPSWSTMSRRHQIEPEHAHQRLACRHTQVHRRMNISRLATQSCVVRSGADFHRTGTKRALSSGGRL